MCDCVRDLEHSFWHFYFNLNVLLSTLKEGGHYKTWTLDSGLDHGLDSGLNNGLDKWTKISIAKGKVTCILLISSKAFVCRLQNLLTK